MAKAAKWTAQVLCRATKKSKLVPGDYASEGEALEAARLFYDKARDKFPGAWVQLVNDKITREYAL